MTRKTADYLQNAQECRRLARLLNMPEHHDALMGMAAVWEELAHDKERRPADNRLSLTKAMDGS